MSRDGMLRCVICTDPLYSAYDRERGVCSSKCADIRSRKLGLRRTAPKSEPETDEDLDQHQRTSAFWSARHKAWEFAMRELKRLRKERDLHKTQIEDMEWQLDMLEAFNDKLAREAGGWKRRYNTLHRAHYEWLRENT